MVRFLWEMNGLKWLQSPYIPQLMITSNCNDIRNVDLLSQVITGDQQNSLGGFVLCCTE